MFPAVVLGVIYAICSGLVIMFLSFTIAIFLGITVLDILENSNYSKLVKFWSITTCAMFPEIGVFSWAVYFGKKRKLLSRIIAAIVSLLSILFQASYIYTIIATDELERSSKLWAGIFVHFIGVPFILIGAIISFFVLRTLQLKKSTKTISNNYEITAQ